MAKSIPRPTKDRGVAGAKAATKSRAKSTAATVAKAAELARSDRRVVAKAPNKRAAHVLADAAVDEPLVSTTVRLRHDIRQGLELLQRKLGGTMNKLMNDGLAMYISVRAAAFENDLRASLEEIKKLRRADPMFTKDFAEIAQAEVMYRAEDPVEGVATRDGTVSAVSMVRDVIAAHR
ncbi:MAG: hypothetical protein ACKVQU_23585 [Burkholderiales bacterium]